MEEFNRHRVSNLPEGEAAKVCLKDCAFRWGFKVDEAQELTDAKKINVQESEEAVLSDISFSLNPGDHLVVVGQVGCGKSSLLYSLMEETLLKAGDMSI
mmetsp:Transcript_1952/g.2862  ORF Transcript_1952/g.2862 Transcript_1952/m.2862 type:complete len:99 (-) Transcript_1952:2459-2755(-)